MIIGLHGKMGSGKNEAAQRIAKVSSLPVVEIAYGRKLKESVAALLGVSLGDLEIWKNNPARCVSVGTMVDGLGFVAHKDKIQSVRSFLQRYGTESHRDVFGQDFWLDAALPLPDHAGFLGRYDDALYVVTDMRFPNEAERVKDLGGVTVRIIGPNDDTGSHPSEQTLECDYEIDNTIRDDRFASLDAQLAALLDAISDTHADVGAAA